MRQGVLGLKVCIMASLEKKKGNTTMVMPDHVVIHDPKDENHNIVPGVEFAQRRE